MVSNIETDFNTDKTNFLRLSTPELVQRVHSITDKKLKGRLWSRDTGFFPIYFSEPIKNEDGEITGIKVNLEAQNTVLKSEEGKDFFIYFQDYGVKYFSKIKIDFILPKTEMSITLKSYLFKLDQRNNVRVKTYPDHEVYAFFQLKGVNNEAGNLVLINNIKNDQLEFFKTFKEAQYGKTFKGQKPFNLANMIGFRVQDISATGISILCNEVEKNFFSRGYTNFHIVMSANGERLNLDGLNVVYINPFELAVHGNVLRYRIGFEFPFQKIIVNLFPEVEGDGKESLSKFEKFLED